MYYLKPGTAIIVDRKVHVKLVDRRTDTMVVNTMVKRTHLIIALLMPMAVVVT